MYETCIRAIAQNIEVHARNIKTNGSLQSVTMKNRIERYASEIQKTVDTWTKNRWSLRIPLTSIVLEVRRERHDVG